MYILFSIRFRRLCSTVNAYAWNAETNEAPTGWPGAATRVAGYNEFGQAVHYMFIPDYCNMIIFNDGSGTQSVDTSLSGHSAFYLDQLNGDKWTLGLWDPQPNFIVYNPLDDYQLGDVNRDGYVNITDVTKIQKALIKLETLVQVQGPEP